MFRYSTQSWPFTFSTFSSLKCKYEQRAILTDDFRKTVVLNPTKNDDFSAQGLA